MICYKDTTFCASKVKEHTCGREFTEQDAIDAEKLVVEAMEKFSIKKGVKYDVKTSDNVIVLTATKEETND